MSHGCEELARCLTQSKPSAIYKEKNLTNYSGPMFSTSHTSQLILSELCYSPCFMGKETELREIQ